MQKFQSIKAKVEVWNKLIVCDPREKMKILKNIGFSIPLKGSVMFHESCNSPSKV